MVRIIIYLMKLILAMLFALLFSSCQYSMGESITGSGNVTTQQRDLKDFTGIKVSSGLEVEVEQGDTFGVTVEADDNVQEHIFTTVESGVLIIRTDINRFKNVNAKNIRVKMPHVSSLEASSGSEIKSRNTLLSDNLKIDASSAGQIKINTEADNITCSSSSGSSIEISGKALIFNTDSSSGSEIDADDLLANEITANASSGSSIDVHPILNLNAEASSGSSITYKNVPKNISKSTSSGGSVSQE